MKMLVTYNHFCPLLLVLLCLSVVFSSSFLLSFMCSCDLFTLHKSAHLPPLFTSCWRSLRDCSLATSPHPCTSATLCFVQYRSLQNWQRTPSKLTFLGQFWNLQVESASFISARRASKSSSPGSFFSFAFGDFFDACLGLGSLCKIFLLTASEGWRQIAPTLCSEVCVLFTVFTHWIWCRSQFNSGMTRLHVSHVRSLESVRDVQDSVIQYAS